MWKKLHYLDWKIFVPYVILTILGIVMVYSSSSYILLINGFNPTTYGVRQAFFVAFSFLFIGIPCFAVKLSIFKNKKVVKWLLLVSIAMLGFLLVLKFTKGSAAAVNGAVGWINLGPINLQPLEIAKLSLVFYLAFVLDKRDGKLVKGRFLENLIHPMIITGFLMVLVLMEPDFGGMSILFMIAFVMMMVSGIPTKLALRSLLGLLLFVVVVFSLIVIWNPKFIQDSYQFQRLLAFLHPFKLEKGSGAQLVNSYYAIHNGGLFGTGLGNSMQKKGYLPEPYTDFILSITAEELGVIVTIIILFLLFWMMWWIMDVGVKAKSQYNALLCYGITTIIFTQTFFNVGALLGLLPITGVTLPFISYGGSSIMVLTACVGIVLNVSATEKRLQQKQEGVE